VHKVNADLSSQWNQLELNNSGFVFPQKPRN